MRIAFTVIAALAATAAYSADDGRTAAERTVTVCLDAGSGPSTWPSRELASRIFAGIGVTIQWRSESRNCPAQAILISLSSRTPPALMPGSLAYALPYEGRHIVVFYDRIAQEHPGLVKPLLAHVLAHEITHLLQAENRHSASGIMKGRWTDNDYEDMKHGLLAFSAEDIDLIYRGLVARTRANSCSPASARIPSQE